MPDPFLDLLSLAPLMNTDAATANEVAQTARAERLQRMLAAKLAEGSGEAEVVRLHAARGR
jgi:uncharacterized protein YciW